MKKFNRVAIIGVGLIGGSLGLAIRKNRLAKEIVGVCRTARSLRQAKRRGAIHRGTTRVKEAVKGADFVILAAPISDMVRLASQMNRFLSPGTLLTDVASTKRKVVREIEKRLPKSAAFVGSHPMAGRELTGVRHARSDLFEKHVCLVTRHPRTPRKALQKICSFWRRLGCRVVVVSPERHDRLVASFSHLPHLIAALLVLHAEKLPLAGTGFRDMTRIVSSDPLLWRDIFATNQGEISASLNRFRKRLDRAARDLQKENTGAALRLFRKAKVLRDRSFR